MKFDFNEVTKQTRENIKVAVRKKSYFSLSLTSDVIKAQCIVGA